MRKTIFFVMILIFPALAQEEMFGYKVLNEPLKPAIASYIGREVWAYGNLDIYCQNPRDTQQVSRFYNTTPRDKLTIQNLVLVELPENYWQQIVHVNGGFTQPGDYSGVSSETAFLIVLQTETPIEDNGSAASGTSLSYDTIVEEKCQKFFTVALPKLMFLERIFSFTPFAEIAEQKGWSGQDVQTILDVNTSVTVGMTRDMVLWKLGAPLKPLNLEEASSATHWSYLSYVPFSHDVDFDQDGKISQYVEGRLP
jgi:hypothetical protein